MTDILPYKLGINQTAGMRDVIVVTPSMEKNATLLVNNLVNEAAKTLVMPGTLNERLEKKADVFLNLERANSIKFTTLERAIEIFNEKSAEGEIKLSPEQQKAVNDTFLYIKEKLALAQTAIRGEAEQRSSFQSSRNLLNSISQPMSSNKEDFLVDLTNLLKKTYVSYEGYGKYPDINQSLADLIEPKMQPEILKKIPGNSNLEKTLKFILIEADGHFKCEKDQKETSELELLIGRSRNSKPSKYLELGSSRPGTNLRESNGLTLRKDFASQLNSLLERHNLIRTDIRFENSDLAHLRTFALEAAAAKAKLELAR